MTEIFRGTFDICLGCCEGSDPCAECTDNAHDVSYSGNDSGHGFCDPLSHDNLETITNTLGATAIVRFEGSVDDDVLINGVVLPCDPDYGTGQPCIYDCELNGTHGFRYCTTLAPDESFTIGVNNNFVVPWSISGTVYMCLESPP